MQSRISPDNWQKVSGLGINESILNRAVLQICKIKYFSMIEGSFTDFTALYTALKLEKMVSCVLESRMLWSGYIGIFIQGKQIPIKFAEEFLNTVLCIWELHIALKYTCLWWVRTVFFCVSIRKYFSICSSDIYYTISFNDF